MKISDFKTSFAFLVAAAASLLSCDDEPAVQEQITLTTISGNQVSMNGDWLSDCALTNTNMILKETMMFENENLRIDIYAYETLNCDGPPLSSEFVLITFSTSGTAQVLFNDEEVTVNRIDGTATYSDGRSEVFKQVFLVDDAGNDLRLYHGLFGEDGGALDADGYPTDIIPLSLVKE